MADFHQKYMCYRMLNSWFLLGNDKDNFLYSSGVVKDGSVIDIEKDPPGLTEQCLTLFSKHHLTIAYPLTGYISPAVCNLQTWNCITSKLCGRCPSL